MLFYGPEFVVVVDFAAEVVVVLLVVSCKQGLTVISSGGWKTFEMSNGVQLLMFARPIVDSSWNEINHLQSVLSELSKDLHKVHQSSKSQEFHIQ